MAQVSAHASFRILPATETTDTVCHPCPVGFFSNQSSLFEKCYPWTRYKGHLSLTNDRVGLVSVSLATCCSVPDFPHPHGGSLTGECDLVAGLRDTLCSSFSLLLLS